jgi:transposase-like protein
MTPRLHHKQIDPEGQATLRDLLQEKMKLAIQYTLIQALEEEVEIYIQAAPHERRTHRRAHRNGTYRRGLGTSMGEIEDLTAIAGDRRNWTKASAKCSCKGSAPKKWAELWKA